MQGASCGFGVPAGIPYILGRPCLSGVSVKLWGTPIPQVSLGTPSPLHLWEGAASNWPSCNQGEPCTHRGAGWTSPHVGGDPMCAGGWGVPGPQESWRGSLRPPSWSPTMRSLGIAHNPMTWGRWVLQDQVHLLPLEPKAIGGTEALGPSPSWVQRGLP